MTEAKISRFVRGIDRALIPSGHLFLWVDKFHLCQGVRPWINGTSLDIVDLMTWDKGTFGVSASKANRRARYMRASRLLALHIIGGSILNAKTGSVLNAH